MSNRHDYDEKHESLERIAVEAALVIINCLPENAIMLHGLRNGIADVLPHVEGDVAKTLISSLKIWRMKVEGKWSDVF